MRGSMFPTGIMPASVRRNPCRVNFLKSGKFKADSGGKPETGNHLSTVSTDIGGRSLSLALSRIGLIRTFGEVGIGLQPYSLGEPSGCMDDAYAKKIKLRAAIHGAFDELQPVDIPFHGTVAP